MDLSSLSDEVLLGKVQALAETERFSLVDLLMHLAELDLRDACQRLGYSSVFSYLTRCLGYSECEAVRRVKAARAVRRFPSILGMLARGDLHLAGVSLLAPVLTSENHRNVLSRACRKSKREIETIAASLSPASAEPRDRMRALPPAASPGPAAPVLPPELPISTSGAFASAKQSPQAQPVPPAPAPRRVFTFTARPEVHRWFLQARDLLRHKFPDGRMEDVFGESLRLLLERSLPSGGRTTRRRPPVPGSRRIPKSVRDQVWRRDRGRCAFVGPGGVRCAETSWLEYDHIRPWALGGRSDAAANVRLLCRAHNQSSARRAFPPA